MGLSDDRAAMREQMGTWGAWIGALTAVPASRGRPAARRAEELGFPCLWYPEGMGVRESFSNAAVLLGATERILVASGIANVWARDAIAAASASRTLNDSFDDRFLLGLGVSHPPQVDPRGQTTYLKPVAKMREYLGQIERGAFDSPDGTEDDAQGRVHTIIAALRPPMLEVARDLSLGAHPYLVPVEHTVRAREILGADPILAVEHKAIVCTDPGEARARARAGIGWYLGIDNYRRNLLWMGFEEADFADGGSDRLIDALVAHGSAESVVEQLRGHLEAGADHVAIQPLGTEDDPCGLRILEELAPLLA
ncbi:MAG: TIGR03620 family F420-dependent LLM class oxidoreductase [Gaiellales bacterium]